MVTLADAARLGAVVDRLIIGVHRAVAARHGAEFRQCFVALDLTHPGLAIDLAEFLLADACDPEIVRERFRYDPADPMGHIDDLVRRGLLSSDLHPGTELEELAQVALDRRAAVAAELWPGDLDAQLGGAASAVARVSGPLALAFAALPVPGRPAAALHHLLTVLRYERMDAHAAAWAAHDLDATEIVALTAAIDAPDSPPRSPPAALVDRGLIERNGQPTDAGRVIRKSIEVDTNRRCVPVLAGVDDWPAWSNALTALISPGSDRR